VPENFEKFTDPESLELAGQAPAGPKKARRFSVVVLTRIVAVLLAGAISGLMIREVHRIQVLDKEQQRLAELTQHRAELTAKNVEVYTQGVIDALAQFVAKPGLEIALRNGDSEQLEHLAGLFKAQVEHVEKLRFIPRGTARLDPDAVPPIRFTELELIRFAEEGKTLRPEAVKLEKQWFLTFVDAIPAAGEDEPVGSVMLSLNTNGLREALKQSNIGMGKVELIQRFGKERPRVVARHDADTVADGQTAKVEGMPWYVKYEPSYRMLDQVEVNIPVILAGVAAISLLLLVFAYWLGNGLGKRIERVREHHIKGAWNNIAAIAKAGSGSDDIDYVKARKTDILDVSIADEDEKLLGLRERQRAVQRAKKEKLKQAEEPGREVPDVVFRAYDIRGVYKTQITHDLAFQLGQALGSEAIDIGEEALIVARDARLSSPQLTEYLIRGILSSGCHVINIGTVPTPLLYFATETLGESSSGVMVTASHNPATENGFKIVMGGQCRSEDDIKAIRSRIIAHNVYEGRGEEKRTDVVPKYIDTIFSDVALAGEISIVVDAANAVAGMVAPRLFEELGCQVTPLFCDLDGKFPNHPPDPSVAKHLNPLIAKVKEVKADLGIALDGDGDRLVAVTPSGKIVWPDQLLMVLAKDIVSRNPGADVVFDVKSTRHLNNCITDVGGRPIMWRTGHSPMKAKMQETGALVGGEYSGHLFIKDRWFGFDDGLYAAARLIEILSLQGCSMDDLLDELPVSPSTPEIRVRVDESRKFELVETLIKTGNFGDGKITTLDGIRVDFANGWGLVRASNTSAHITMRFEADDEDALHKLKALFVREMRKIDSSFVVNWDQ